jgi:hypothetical protein
MKFGSNCKLMDFSLSSMLLLDVGIVAGIQGHGTTDIAKSGMLLYDDVVMVLRDVMVHVCP